MDRELVKKNKLPRKVTIGLLAASILVFVTYSLFFVDHTKQMSVANEELTIVEVKKGSFQEYDGRADRSRTGKCWSMRQSPPHSAAGWPDRKSVV